MLLRYKTLQHSILFLVIITLPACATKKSACHNWLYNEILSIKMPSIEKKIESSKSKIIDTINQNIQNIPQFEKTITIDDTTYQKIPHHLSASIKFSSANTTISKLAENQLIIEDPSFDSNCRLLTSPIKMSIQTTTIIPLNINGIPNLKYYQKWVECHTNLKYLFRYKKGKCSNNSCSTSICLRKIFGFKCKTSNPNCTPKICQPGTGIHYPTCDYPDKTLSGNILNLKPELTVKLNLKLKIDPFKKIYFISPLQSSDIKISYQCNDDMPDIIFGYRIEDLDNLTHHLRKIQDNINSVLKHIEIIKFQKEYFFPLPKPNLPSIPDKLSEFVKKTGNDQCQQQLKMKTDTIKETIATQLNAHLKDFKGTMPK